MAETGGHGVALAVLDGHDGQPVITARCECGWHANFAEVTTFDAVAELVNGHRGDVLVG